MGHAIGSGCTGLCAYICLRVLGVVLDFDVKHLYFSINFLLLGPFDAWVL